METGHVLQGDKKILMLKHL